MLDVFVRCCVVDLDGYIGDVVFVVPVWGLGQKSFICEIYFRTFISENLILKII